MNRKIKSTALALMVVTACGSVAMAHPYMKNHQDYYQNQRVVQAVTSQRSSGVYSVEVDKVLDKTSVGVGEKLMSRIGEIIRDDDYEDATARQQAIQNVLDKEKAGKFTVAAYNNDYGPKHIDLYMIFDSDRLDDQMRKAERERSRWADENYGLNRRESLADQQHFADRINDVLKRIGVPWSIEKLTEKEDRSYFHDKEISRRSVYDVNEYRVIDHTNSLAKEDLKSLQDFAKPYMGKKVLGKDVFRVEDENQDYLDRAYGKNVYEVRVMEAAGQNNRLNIYVDRAANGRILGQGLRLGVIDETRALSREDLQRIDDVVADYQKRSGNAKSLAEQAEDAVEAYLDNVYGKDAYDTKLTYRQGNFYQIRVRQH